MGKSLLPASADQLLDYSPSSQYLKNQRQLFIEQYKTISKISASLSKQYFDVLHDDSISEQIRSWLISDLILAINDIDMYFNTIAAELRNITENIVYDASENPSQVVGDTDYLFDINPAFSL